MTCNSATIAIFIELLPLSLYGGTLSRRRKHQISSRKTTLSSQNARLQRKRKVFERKRNIFEGKRHFSVGNAQVYCNLTHALRSGSATIAIILLHLQLSNYCKHLLNIYCKPYAAHEPGAGRPDQEAQHRRPLRKARRPGAPMSQRERARPVALALAFAPPATSCSDFTVARFGHLPERAEYELCARRAPRCSRS